MQALRGEGIARGNLPNGGCPAPSKINDPARRRQFVTLAVVATALGQQFGSQRTHKAATDDPTHVMC